MRFQSSSHSALPRIRQVFVLRRDLLNRAVLDLNTFLASKALEAAETITPAAERGRADGSAEHISPEETDRLQELALQQPDFAVLPADAPCTKRADDRRLVSGFLYIIRKGLQWKDAPKEPGPRETLYRQWHKIENMFAN